METVELSAKNVDEAVGLALSKLALGRSEVTIEVVREGKSGILGWGGEDAVVRVTPLPIADENIAGEEAVSSERLDTGIGEADVLNVAKQVTGDLLSLLDVQADLTISGLGTEESPVVIDIDSAYPGMLIGRRGQTLASLQYITSIIVSRKVMQSARVIVDVGGYRDRRCQEIKGVALRACEQVKSSQRSIALEPMSAAERRMVHLELRDDQDISTESMGFGDSRKIVIYPRKHSEGSEENVT